MAIEQPLDHNAECRYCDEQAMHRVDCPWLIALIATVDTADLKVRTARARIAELEADKAALELLVKELLDAAR